MYRVGCLNYGSVDIYPTCIYCMYIEGLSISEREPQDSGIEFRCFLNIKHFHTECRSIYSIRCSLVPRCPTCMTCSQVLTKLHVYREAICFLGTGRYLEYSPNVIRNRPHISEERCVPFACLAFFFLCSSFESDTY